MKNNSNTLNEKLGNRQSATSLPFYFAREISLDDVNVLNNRINEQDIIHHSNYTIDDVDFLESIEFISPFQVPKGVYKERGFMKTGEVKFHNGLDLVPTSSNWNLVASADGVITDEGWSNTFGNYTIIKLNPHPDYLKDIPIPPHSYYLLYAHMKSKSLKKTGSYVKAGEQLGVVGNTGTVGGLPVGYHLHIEILKNLYQDQKTGKTQSFSLNPYMFPFLYEAFTGEKVVVET